MQKKCGKGRKIIIFDTTLRDGEQSPGATLTHQEKILVARQLEKLNVDVIEAGFPISSEDDFKAVKEIASSVSKPIVCGLARAKKQDIESAAKAIEAAKKPRIHTFMSSSDIHLREQFKIDRKTALKWAVEAVKLAKNCCDDVEFSPMDATRTEPSFLYEMIEKTIEAGATTINIPDTVGYAEPSEFGALIKSIRENVPNMNDATLSVHCHNDLGLAVANSLEAIRNGAEQVECTINGIGERAGNASLEEVVMNIYSRKDYFCAFTEINLSEIYNSSKMVSGFTGIVVQPNKAIVGRNAFAHESGIHQQGIINCKESYEIIDPKLIGKETELVLGKHSGKHAIESFLKSKGFLLEQKQIEDVVAKVKELAGKNKAVFDDDVIAIANEVSGMISESSQIIKLDEIIVNTGNKTNPFAKVRLLLDGRLIEGTGKGVGPVDAVSKAVEQALGDFTLEEYNLKAITGGTDALADVVVTIKRKGSKFSARAIDEDIIMASAKAIIKALNYAFISERRNKQ